MNQHAARMRATWKRVSPATGAALLALITALGAPKVAVGQQAKTPQPQATAALRLLAVNPTVLYVQREEGLRQVAEVTIENVAAAVEASLEVRLGAQGTSTALGKLNKGKSTAQVHVPDVRQPTPVAFVLRAEGKLQDRRTMTWQPGRHWEVCLVPISHHDLGYTDTIENVLRKYDGFYDDILRFCEQTDDWPEEAKFRYTVEGTWSIQHFVENRPKQVLEKLGKYVKAGRIEVPALFGNEISGLCSHEGLIRLMYPSFRLKREFGASIRTASITDIPGLSWGLPTVLAGADVKYFFAGLPGYFQWGRNDIHTFWDEAAILRHGRPDAFRWQGPDGQSVLVYYQGGYGCWGPTSYRDALAGLPAMLAAMEKQGCPFSVVRYAGYGCGDNTPPDVRASHVVREWNSRWAYPRLTVATNSIFFEKLQKQCQDVRVFRGELPHTDYVVGAASTAEETAVNRLTHDQLQAAEKFAAIAFLLADSLYPMGPIRNAYDDVLLYDEHTWGMAHQVGKLQDWNWADKSRYAYRAAGLAESVLWASVNRIGDRISREEEGEYVVVFNQLCLERTDVVRVPSFRAQGPLDVIDQQTGSKVPYQIVEIDTPQAPVPYGPQRYARGQFNPPERFDLVFVAEGVPPMGWKTYRLVPAGKAAAFPTSAAVGTNSLENRLFKVALDPQTGAVESIYDKELTRQIVDPQAPHKLNQLVVKRVTTGGLESPKKAQLRKGQSGPVYASLLVSSETAGCPQVTQEIVVYDKLKRIDVANRVLRDSTPLVELYFAFPFQIDKPSFRFEGSDSVIEPLRDQFPGSNSNYYTVQHWADVSNGQAGATLSAIESHLLEFGGLWPCYVSQAHHGVDPPDFGRDFVKPGELSKGYMYAFVHASNFRTNFPPLRQGDLLFRYAITTHQGDWKAGRPRDFGWAVANPLIPLRVSGKHKGTLGGTTSFCQVQPANVFLLTLKRAEEGDGIIVRLVETEGKEAMATLTLPHVTVQKAIATNLVEENQAALASAPHQVTVPVKAFGLTTIRLQVR